MNDTREFQDNCYFTNTNFKTVIGYFYVADNQIDTHNFAENLFVTYL